VKDELTLMTRKVVQKLRFLMEKQLFYMFIAEVNADMVLFSPWHLGNE